MRITNIHNKNSKIYIFSRNENGKQIIRTDDSFRPFYFEPDEKGEYRGYDGTPLRKVFASLPKDISQRRSDKAFAADIKYTNNYLTHKVDKIEPCPFTYLFIDIEVLAKEFPEPSEAKYPVSCITVWHSATKEYTTWWLDDYKKESKLLEAFIDYVKLNPVDFFAAWNINFDYTYLHNRCPNFAKKISPINQVRAGNAKNIFYPAGISIVDYLTYFKKVFMRESSYALDNIAQAHLDEKSWGNQVFGDLDETVKDKNVNDVKRLVKLEEKYNLFPYYDEIRRLSKCKWEDLYHNSRIVEMMLMEEAKIQNIILPSKKVNEEDEKIKGAIRDTLKSGRFFDVLKVDLSSAYPTMLIEFCLDTQNITKQTKDTVKVDKLLFKQNKNALLPLATKKILTIKNKLKKDLKENPELQKKYDAIKAIVNSFFGAVTNEFFRLYDTRVGSSITYLVRDLITYSIKRLKEEGYETLYYDTDSLFINTPEIIVDKLNQYIQDWVKTYNKESIDLDYAYEGHFDKLFLHSTCHYYGYIRGQEKPEIKGMEIKRVSSSKYESEFQRELIEKILNNEEQDNIEKWVQSERSRIKTVPLLNIVFPCKIKNTKYLGKPVFLTAKKSTQMIYPKFTVENLELFYYVYVKNLLNDIYVLALKTNDNDFLDWSKYIDWGKMIERSIDRKTEKIFEALKWKYSKDFNITNLFN